MYFIKKCTFTMWSLWIISVECLYLTDRCDRVKYLNRTVNDEVDSCLRHLYRTVRNYCVYSSYLYDFAVRSCSEIQDIKSNPSPGVWCIQENVDCSCGLLSAYCISLELTLVPQIHNSIWLFNLGGNQLDGTIINTTFVEYDELRYLDISSNKIEHLEPFVFHSLKDLGVLVLRNNRIKYLEKNAFGGLKSLDVLDLSKNQIMKLKPEHFLDLEELTSLDLSNNNIVHIENTTFNKLQNLIVLDISTNSITRLLSNTFQNLKELMILYLNNNQIESIEIASFEGLQNLISLNLSNNQLKVLQTNVFHSLNHVMELFLNFNEIGQLGNGSFNGLTDLEYIYLSNNRITELTSNMFQDLQKLSRIYLQFNEIIMIEEQSFRNNKDLFELALDNNKLKTLPSNIMQNNETMWRITINNNEITAIEDLEFALPANLHSLELSNNAITRLKPNGQSFQKLAELNDLSLDGNSIDSIGDYAFNGLHKLFELSLQRNRLTHIKSVMFQNLEKLSHLYLDYNEIVYVESFSWGKKLVTLSLSHNKLQIIIPSMFDGMNQLSTLNLNENEVHTIADFSFVQPQLTTLNISHNNIENITDKTFAGSNRLTKLYMAGNQITSVDRNAFKNNTWLNTLETDEFGICCLAKRSLKRLKLCQSPSNEFSSCQDLLANYVLRTCIWILGIIAVLNNIYVIILRSRRKNSSSTSKIHSFLIINLAFSDLFMGIYLLIIGTADFSYRKEYYLHDLEWRLSGYCNFAGFISTFSSELSIFTLTVITMDRLLSILFPYKNQNRGINRTKVLMAIGWIGALVISILPLPFLGIKYFKHFYGRSGVCLALHITDDKPSGYLYSVSIFIVLNAISFIVIAASYILMYRSLNKARPPADLRVTNRPTKQGMAFRMSLLVAADAACWIPIIGLGIKSLFGYITPPNVYAWIAVFVLPLNAALNPILYTLTSMECIQIKYFNSRFSGRLRFRWPCYWEKKEKQTSTCNPTKTTDTKL